MDGEIYAVSKHVSQAGLTRSVTRWVEVYAA